MTTVAGRNIAGHRGPYSGLKSSAHKPPGPNTGGRNWDVTRSLAGRDQKPRQVMCPTAVVPWYRNQWDNSILAGIGLLNNFLNNTDEVRDDPTSLAKLLSLEARAVLQRSKNVQQCELGN